MFGESSKCNYVFNISFKSVDELSVQIGSDQIESYGCDIPSSSSSVNRTVETNQQITPQLDSCDQPNGISNSDDPVMEAINKLRSTLARRHSLPAYENLFEMEQRHEPSEDVLEGNVDLGVSVLSLRDDDEGK